MIGIYKITNMLNDKVYIGQSTDIESRFKEHKDAILNSNLLWYPLLRQEITTLKDCAFDIVEICEEKDLYTKERFWIRYYRADLPEFGYNSVYPNQWFIKIKKREMGKKNFIFL